jgi:hypothetical protein
MDAIKYASLEFFANLVAPFLALGGTVIFYTFYLVFLKRGGLFNLVGYDVRYRAIFEVWWLMFFLFTAGEVLYDRSIRGVIDLLATIASFVLYRALLLLVTKFRQRLQDRRHRRSR